GIATNDAASFNVSDHYRTCSDYSIVVDVNVRANECIGRNPDVAANGKPGAQKGEGVRLVVVRPAAKVCKLRDYGMLANTYPSQVVYFNAPGDNGVITDIQ